MEQVLTRKNRTRKCLKLSSEEKYFIQNGGALLEKCIALSHGQDTGAGDVKFLSTEDIENAGYIRTGFSCGTIEGIQSPSTFFTLNWSKANANYHDPNIILGTSSTGKIYMGILDDHAVVIKIPLEFTKNAELIDIFLTEASIGMVMNHHNMVRLYSCCLETSIPMLVYKFLPKGSLFEHLHGQFSFVKSRTWEDRLRVALDVSYALSYMHNALPKPVVHRNVQSHNILLGDSFCAKLSSFGYSVSISPGETPKRWPIQGTPGYIDPEYIETEEVTDKCDVYSFGVLLLELLVRKYPQLMVKNGNETNLVDLFVSATKKNQVMEIVDRELIDQASSNEIEWVTHIALKCVAKKGVDRPTMIKVADDLRHVTHDMNSESTAVDKSIPFQLELETDV